MPASSRQRPQRSASGKKQAKDTGDIGRTCRTPSTPKTSPKEAQKITRGPENGPRLSQAPRKQDAQTGTPLLSHWGTLKKIAVPQHLLSRTHNLGVPPTSSTPQKSHRNTGEFWVNGTISLQRIQKSLDEYNSNLRRFQHAQEFERLRSSIDNYKIIRCLGRHDGWEKQLALHRLSDDLVVIIREKSKPGSAELADRVLFLKQVSQFNVAMPIFELFQDREDLCIVTLYCRNGNVATHFQQQKASLFTIKTFLVKLMRGLQRLYECGVVPLDLTWSRVMVDPRGEPRISNFCYRKIAAGPAEDFKSNTRILSSFLIQKLQDPRVFPGMPGDVTKVTQNMGLNTRRIGDLLRNLMQERFFMAALASEHIKFEHDMTPLEITEHNEAIFKGFLKVFYRRHIDLSSAIHTAINHSFLRQAAAHPDSQWNERNEAHEAALLTYYENFLGAKGVLPEFTRFCVAAKRNNPIKSGFRALLARGGPK